MNNIWKSWEPKILSVLRIITGFLFLWHGSSKFFGFPPSAQSVGAMSAFKAFTGVLELGGGLLILVGLFTRWTAFILSGMMAVAYWMVFGTKGDSFLPLTNGGELPVMFCFVFFYLFFAGGGSWSMDNLLSKKE